MARYRKIDPRIWNDEKFRMLSHESQRLFLFVLTHPALTMIGAMRATRSGLAEELGLSEKAFREAFQEALSKGMLKYDEKAFLLWLPNFLKFNSPESPNVVKSWDSALDLLPECDLRIQVLASAKSYISTMSEAFQEALPKAFREALHKDLAKSMPNQEQEQEQEQNIYSSSLSPQQAVGTTGKESVDLPKQDKTPTKRIVELYNEQFKGKLPLVREITNKRRGLVRSVYDKMFKRCECANEDEGLIAVREYFSAIEKSKWLMGQDPKSNGWRADFDFVFTERCYVGMLEGKYANR